MDWSDLLDQLTALAERLDIEVRHVRYEGEGGLCRLRGANVLIVNDLLDVPDRVDVVARALAGIPELNKIHMPPEVRELLDRVANEDS
jgi:hypothetical protein